MRRSSRTPDGDDQSPGLFDLPLEPERSTDRSERSDRSVRPSARPAPAEPVLPLTPARTPKDRSPTAPRPLPRPAPSPAARPEAAGSEPDSGGESAVGLKSRFMAGGADLLVHAAVAVAAIAGSRLLGAPPSPSDWPPVALFLLTFSFLYTVLPLAFWGQTLGMAWAGLHARSRDGEALSFDQTARRWLGGLVTAATLGLPLLATGSRRSLSDRVSGSGTYRTR
jgi:uncharacterized RDD family membrane protein YckC